jgi:uncharacterized protein YeeX (DUF496 family)
MNKLSFIPNKIKQPSQCCTYCGKGYKTKTYLEKHIVLCEITHQSKRYGSSFVDYEEEELPPPKKMFQLLLELGQKYSKLEEKVEEMNKWMAKKKKKINVLEWLNQYSTPEDTFENIIHKIIIIDDDIEYLFEHTFHDTLNEIFVRSIYGNIENNTSIPICAFIQKTNIFYIYDHIEYNNTNSEKKWHEIPKDIFKRFLNKIQMKLTKTFCEWKKKQNVKIKENDTFATNCDKTYLKIISQDFSNDSTLNKLKSIVFNKMKKDMKELLVEVEFEF